MSNEPCDIAGFYSPWPAALAALAGLAAGLQHCLVLLVLALAAGLAAGLALARRWRRHLAPGLALAGR
jgi:hypothetical protein